MKIFIPLLGCRGVLLVVAIAMLLAGCVHTTRHLREVQRLEPSMLVIGHSQDARLKGLWAGSLRAVDGVGPPYDTVWTLVMKDVRFVACNDSFLIARDSGEKNLLMVTMPSGRTLICRTKSNRKFNETKVKWAVPEGLILQEVSIP